MSDEAKALGESAAMMERLAREGEIAREYYQRGIARGFEISGMGMREACEALKAEGFSLTVIKKP